MTTEQIIVVVWDMALNGLSCTKVNYPTHRAG